MTRRRRAPVRAEPLCARLALSSTRSKTMVLSSAPTFRTEVPIEPRTHRLIRHDESLLLIGS